MADPMPPQEAPTNGPGAAPAPAPTVPAAEAPLKRQRRPSVRLGDPGEQPAAALPSFDPFSRRPKPPPHHHHHHHRLLYKEPPRPASKTRPLLHLQVPDNEAPSSSDDRAALLPVDENLEPLSAALRRGPRDPKPKKPGPSAAAVAAATKRVRSSWAPPKLDEPPDAAADHKSSGGEEGFRDGSESPSDRGGFVGPTTDATGDGDGDGDAPSETDGDGRDWNNANNNGWYRSVEDGGVRAWLSGLGLGRYAPVFEIHEVDDEVLPMLTLDDLKDMGINAVGSRRKMYCAIQKLRKSLGIFNGKESIFDTTHVWTPDSSPYCLGVHDEVLFGKLSLPAMHAYVHLFSKDAAEAAS